MKTLDEIRQILKERKSFLLRKYGVSGIGIFGSYSRGEERPESDLDILVELERPVRLGLLGLIELEHYLSDLFGTKVDIALRKNLRRRIGRRIMREVIPV